MQIISHLNNVENINEREAKFYTKLNKLLKAVKPGIPIDKIEEGEFLDFNYINSLLHRYDLNLDFIKLTDFNKLKEHLELLLKNDISLLKFEFDINVIFFHIFKGYIKLLQLIILELLLLFI
jgi:hypothetical protein